MLSNPCPKITLSIFGKLMRIYIAILLLLAKILTLGPTMATHHHHETGSLEASRKLDHHHPPEQLEFEEDIIGFLFSNFDIGQEVENYIGTTGASHIAIKKAAILITQGKAFSLVQRQINNSPATYYHVDNQLSGDQYAYRNQLRGPPICIS